MGELSTFELSGVRKLFMSPRKPSLYVLCEIYKPGAPENQRIVCQRIVWLRCFRSIQHSIKLQFVGALANDGQHFGHDFCSELLLSLGHLDVETLTTLRR